MLFRARRFVIETTAAPEEVSGRLRNAVAPRTLSLREPKSPFVGAVGPATFELHATSDYRETFALRIRGTFASDAVGTKVDVRARLPRPVTAFAVLFLSIPVLGFVAGLVHAVAHPRDPWLALAMLAFLLVGYGFFSAAFAYDTRLIRANLVRLLVDGVVPADLRKPDLSWLFEPPLWPRDASPTERAFDVVFFAGWFPAAALAVLAWERTVSSCTNPQYFRRNAYSCPSDARIVLIWVLLVVLLLTVPAWSIARHRRARRLYPLVLVAVATLGATAALLLIHHPRWGVPK